MSDITKFDYDGVNISFEFSDGNRMINATEMAKPFQDKRMNNFLRTKQTKEYIQVLEKRYANWRIAEKREVLRVVKGGDASKGEQGTWMDEKLALKFAAWLSVEFELWVYDRIDELLKTGKTELPDYSPSTEIIRSIRLIADQLEFHGKEIGEIKEDISLIKDHVSDLEAKITSIDEQYYSVSGYCSLHSIPCPLDKAKGWGYNATKESNKKGIAIGKAYDAKYGSINTYHIDILKDVIK
ncbi:KilA-N domain-containing protein [Aureispira anguillae]|uniref:KilA-N domain-containing protein n=1 Tax=Aureispira anguillae TaxID=2864201 RepID=A0A915YM79_9BACT|nr:KilA-N domain-containing protein [Aureispira anguillae]BDS15698.1 KilA-N domain-containing protein [Aureispira anguillae]